MKLTLQKKYEEKGKLTASLFSIEEEIHSYIKAFLERKNYREGELDNIRCQSVLTLHSHSQRMVLMQRFNLDDPSKFLIKNILKFLKKDVDKLTREVRSCNTDYIISMTSGKMMISRNAMSEQDEARFFKRFGKDLETNYEADELPPWIAKKLGK